jgi:uncharacterized protein (DUF4415 family)
MVPDFMKDDAPDLTETSWAEKLAAAPVQRGRPKSNTPKVSITIRLDTDVLEGFRRGGPGWQSRINDALREWLAKQAR